MSIKKIHDEQPKEFKFSDENLKQAELILKKYPKKNNFQISRRKTTKCYNGIVIYCSKTK